MAGCPTLFEADVTLAVCSVVVPLVCHIVACEIPLKKYSTQQVAVTVNQKKLWILESGPKPCFPKFECVMCRALLRGPITRDGGDSREMSEDLIDG